MVETCNKILHIKMRVYLSVLKQNLKKFEREDLINLLSVNNQLELNIDKSFLRFTKRQFYSTTVRRCNARSVGIIVAQFVKQHVAWSARGMHDSTYGAPLVQSGEKSGTLDARTTP